MENALTDQETQLRRLQWRCRRGMLEIDLLLEKFIRLHFQYPNFQQPNSQPSQFKQLTDNELAAFNQLLDYPDNELWAMIVNTELLSEACQRSPAMQMTDDMKHIVFLLQNMLETQFVKSIAG